MLPGKALHALLSFFFLSAVRSDKRRETITNKNLLPPSPGTGLLDPD